MAETFGGKTAAASSPPDPEIEWDTLAAALNRLGIFHLAPGKVRRSGLPRTTQELFERLWLTAEPRLHQAAVVLLLTRPDLARDAQAAIDKLTGTSRDRAMRRYVAAAALQRMARTRIMLDLGSRPLLPPAYLDELALPPLDAEFGRMTLGALAADEETRYGYDAWDTYRTLLDHFLSAIRHSGWGVPCDK
jgi:hypothetical protein